MKGSYGWGDIQREAYQREREAFVAELTILRGAEYQSSILERTVMFLAGLRSALGGLDPDAAQSAHLDTVQTTGANE